WLHLVLDDGSVEIHRDALHDDDISRRAAEFVVDPLRPGIAAAWRRAVDGQRGVIADPGAEHSRDPRRRTQRRGLDHIHGARRNRNDQRHGCNSGSHATMKMVEVRRHSALAMPNVDVRTLDADRVPRATYTTCEYSRRRPARCR